MSSVYYRQGGTESQVSIVISFISPDFCLKVLAMFASIPYSFVILWPIVNLHALTLSLCGCMSLYSLVIFTSLFAFPIVLFFS